MKRLILMVVLAAAASVAAAQQKPKDNLKVQLAQKDLEIAKLTQQLHQAQRASGACNATLNAVFGPQEQQDERAVDAAQKAFDAVAKQAAGAPKPVRGR